MGMVQPGLLGEEEEGGGGAAGYDSQGEEIGGREVNDFEERLNLRLAQKEEEAAAVPDEVRFGEAGWKDRYYATKLHAPKGDNQIRRYVVKCYVEGLCWVRKPSPQAPSTKHQHTPSPLPTSPSLSLPLHHHYRC